MDRNKNKMRKGCLEIEGGDKWIDDKNSMDGMLKQPQNNSLLFELLFSKRICGIEVWIAGKSIWVLRDKLYFEIIGKIKNIEVIAEEGSIRELKRLERFYGSGPIFNGN